LYHWNIIDLTSVSEMDQEQQLQQLQAQTSQHPHQQQRQLAATGQSQAAHQSGQSLHNKPHNPGYQPTTPLTPTALSQTNISLARRPIDDAIVSKAKQEARLRYQTFRELSENPPG
jgi:hypothetical protein